VADYFEATVVACGDAKACGNWVMGDLMHKLNETNLSIAECPVSPERLGELIAVIREGTISHNIAQQVFPKMWATGQAPREIIAAEGLALISDSSEIERLVDEAIAANPKAVADYRGGKEKAIGAIQGHVMRATKGQANAQVVNALILEKLKQ